MNRLRGLYAITDDNFTPNSTIITQSEEILKSGVKILQLRNKINTDEELEEIAFSLKKLCDKYNAIFLINDRINLAIKTKAHGIHLGKNDILIKEARNALPNAIIGVSCYGSLDLAILAQEAKASYVSFGAMFNSKIKPNAKTISHKIIKEAREKLHIPFCVIGGINIKNISEISQLKPHMIAIISAIYQPKSIEENIKNLKNQML